MAQYHQRERSPALPVQTSAHTHQNCAQSGQSNLQKETLTVFSIFPALSLTLGRKDLGVYIPGIACSATLWSRLGLSDASPQPTHTPTKRVLRREANPSLMFAEITLQTVMIRVSRSQLVLPPISLSFLCGSPLIGMTEVPKSLKWSSRRCPLWTYGPATHLSCFPKIIFTFF